MLFDGVLDARRRRAAARSRPPGLGIEFKRADAEQFRDEGATGEPAAATSRAWTPSPP